MERQPVPSTNIASVGYGVTVGILEIEFHSGGIYQYYGVPEFVHQELISAPSIGGYFARNIKNVYPCQRIA